MPPRMRLQIDTPATLNVQLELGQVTESVNVTAEAASVNTQNASVGNPFTETQIKGLPLQTRNIVALLSLQPGVAPDGQVLGAKADQNNVTLDGVDVNDNKGDPASMPCSRSRSIPSRSSAPPSPGRAPTRAAPRAARFRSSPKAAPTSSTARCTSTCATRSPPPIAWFNNRAGVARTPLVRNQYGASIGGRMIRDRAFFFFNWEDRKDRSGSSVTRTVPSETYKQGIVGVALNNGTNAQLTAADIAAVDPLHIGINNYMLSQFKQYPVGNDPKAAADGGLNFSVLRFNAPQKLDNRAYVARMDFQPRHRPASYTLMLRGTLGGQRATDSPISLFSSPGQAVGGQDPRQFPRPRRPLQRRSFRAI